MALLIFAVVSVSAQHKKASEESKQSPQQQCPATAITINNQTQPAQKCECGADRPPGWHKFVTWPESWTAWALIITFIAIAIQAGLMLRHAKELKKLAGAAKRNTDAIIAAERAWLVVEILPIDHKLMWDINAVPMNWALLVNFKVTNSGRTAAKFLSGSIRPHIVETVDPDAHLVVPRLPSPPPYWPDSPIFEAGKMWPPRKEFHCGSVIGKSLIVDSHAEMKDAKKAFCLYGILRYEDSFGKARETRFAYVYQYMRVGGGLLNQKTGRPIDPPGFWAYDCEEYNRST
jgi:hypothetical protein